MLAMLPKLTQGVTTVVTGNCGISLAPVTLRAPPVPPLDLLGPAGDFRYPDFASYMARLERSGLPVNAAPMVGHTTLRVAAMSRLDRPAGDREIAAMQSLVGECIAAGAVTVRDCQAEQTALAVEARRQNGEPVIVMGDMNEEPGSFVYEAFAGRGWLDASAEGGVIECDAVTGVGCTSGREDQDLSGLEATALGVDRRIDFAFVVPPEAGARCAGGLDTMDDLDGDGVATRLFAEEPNPFAPACGPSPAPPCWVSDHTGVQVDWNCDAATALPE